MRFSSDGRRPFEEPGCAIWVGPEEVCFPFSVSRHAEHVRAVLGLYRVTDPVLSAGSYAAYQPGKQIEEQIGERKPSSNYRYGAELTVTFSQRWVGWRAGAGVYCAEYSFSARHLSTSDRSNPRSSAFVERLLA